MVSHITILMCHHRRARDEEEKTKEKGIFVFLRAHYMKITAIPKLKHNSAKDRGTSLFISEHLKAHQTQP